MGTIQEHVFSELRIKPLTDIPMSSDMVGVANSKHQSTGAHILQLPSVYIVEPGDMIGLEQVGDDGVVKDNSSEQSNGPSTNDTYDVLDGEFCVFVMMPFFGWRRWVLVKNWNMLNNFDDWVTGVAGPDGANAGIIERIAISGIIGASTDIYKSEHAVTLRYYGVTAKLKAVHLVIGTPDTGVSQPTVNLLKNDVTTTSAAKEVSQVADSPVSLDILPDTTFNINDTIKIPITIGTNGDASDLMIILEFEAV